jgi:hypothetical protein
LGLVGVFSSVRDKIDVASNHDAVQNSRPVVDSTASSRSRTESTRYQFAPALAR